MKRINFLLGMCLLFFWGIYSFFKTDDLVNQSSTLYAAYEDSCGSSGTVGNVRCSGNTVEYCTTSGSWLGLTECTVACNEGNCTDTASGYNNSTACVNAGYWWDWSSNSCVGSILSCSDMGGVLMDTVECVFVRGGDAGPSSENSGGGMSAYECCVGQYNIGECSTNNYCNTLYGSNYYCNSSGQCVSSFGGGTITPVPTGTGTTNPDGTPDESGCSPVNGSCAGTSGRCASGLSGGGDGQITSTGMDYVWTCLGTCGGTNATCKTTVCTNQPVVNGACNSNITGTTDGDLCYSGDPVYSSNDTNYDYINDNNESEYVWGCEGSTGVCAEGNGIDQSDCLSVINQESWFQVNNGNITVNGKVINYVPVTTCNSEKINCSTTVKSGNIYSKSNSSLSGFDRAEKKEEANFDFEVFPYSKLKKSFFDTKGVGSTFTASTDWLEIKNTGGIVFIDGDLDITGENLETTALVMIIAKGTITIDPSVTRVDAILVANRVVADGEAESQLVINGVVHGISEVKFSRSLTPKSLNNTTPSVVVNYNPKLLFMIPVELSRTFDQWRIN